MQSETIQREKLNTIVQEFRDDSKEQDKYETISQNRTQQIPELQTVMHQFINKELDLREFRDRLQFLVSRDNDPWSIRGPSFMMEINKLRKNHDEHHPYAEDKLRTLLTDLNSTNLGERIEQFCEFLQNEKTRLRREGKPSTQTMAPGNAALMLSMFNYWLNPDTSPSIYYLRTCQGIYKLIHQKLLVEPSDFKNPSYIANNSYWILTKKDHLALQQAIKELTDAVKFFQQFPAYVDSFLYWYTSDLHEKPSESPPLIKEVHKPHILSPTPGKPVTVQEGSGTYTTQQEHPISNPPLSAIPEATLKGRIKKVQNYILLEEKTIRDIYHALLAGHVIMTGPPGTGKTELARLIPEILWGDNQLLDIKKGNTDPQDLPTPTTPTAYATRLVTATDEWSVRTLIGGIAPKSELGKLTYSIQHGYLTTTIEENWEIAPQQQKKWENLKRTHVQAHSALDQDVVKYFHGIWLVIDEFNRAPIDLALGEALTALGGSNILRVPIEGGTAELPIPLDFRIIGTLNSFDRNYLNQISEALKRRFSFVEILPPTRKMRNNELVIALFKALKSISHLSETLSIENDGQLIWQDVLSIEHDPEGFYVITWENEESIQRSTMRACWQLFEVIRVYRQLGTAQAISMMRHMLINGILQNHETAEGWAKALDEALCNTVADQLQVLLPDEIEALYLYLKLPHARFAGAYNQLLANLADTPRRLRGQLASLNAIMNEDGEPYLSDELLEQLEKQDQPQVPETVLNGLFHLEQEQLPLPLFMRRLRTFKQERGL